MMQFSPLHDRSLFAVRGKDARDFLQGLITRDMRKVVPDTPVFAALLSPQGRFLYDFFILERADGFWFDTQSSRMPELIRRLQMYRLRSEVTFDLMPQMTVVTWWGEGAPPADSLACYADPRLSALGWRAIMPESAAPGPSITPADYAEHRIALGVPDGAEDLTFDRSILLEYGYDELHGVDFDKGCYVGQEVTARSKHRATLRKFIHIMHSDDALPVKGTRIMAGEREVGTLTSARGCIGLAHLQVDAVRQASTGGPALTAAGAEVTAQLPPWCAATFDPA